jgi:hypothetical protein
MWALDLGVSMACVFERVPSERHSIPPWGSNRPFPTNKNFPGVLLWGAAHSTGCCPPVTPQDPPLNPLTRPGVPHLSRVTNSGTNKYPGRVAPRQGNHQAAAEARHAPHGAKQKPATASRATPTARPGCLSSHSPEPLCRYRAPAFQREPPSHRPRALPPPARPPCAARPRARCGSRGAHVR